MERPIFSLLLTTYHGVFDSYLVFPWRPIMFINDDQWSRLLGRRDLFLFMSYLYSWQKQQSKTTHFHQQKLRKYNQQGYKIPPAWQKLEMKKLLHGYFYNHKRQFQVVCYVFFAIMLCPYNNMDWTLMEWGYFLINCYCFHYLHCQLILPFDSFRVSCLKNDNNVYIMQIIW